VAEWAPFQTHYYSENLVAPGIEPETSVSVARNYDLDHRGGHFIKKLPTKRLTPENSEIITVVR